MPKSRRELELELELERKRARIQSPNAPTGLSQEEVSLPNELLTGTVPVRNPLDQSAPDLARIAVPQGLEAGLIGMGEGGQLAASRATGGAVPSPDLTATDPLRPEFGTEMAIGRGAVGLAAPGAGSTLSGALGAGAAIGALTADDPAMGALVGGAFAPIGNVAARAVGKAISPFRSATGFSERALKLSKRHKIPLTPGQRTGSARMRNLETVTQRTSITTNALDDFDAAQRAAVNRTALKSIGRRGDKITDNILESKRQELSNGFEKIGKSVKSVQVTDDFLDELARITDEANDTLTADSLALYNRNLDKLLDRLGSRPGGRFLMEQATKLDRTAGALAKRGDGAGDLLFDVKEAVDDLFEKNAGRFARARLTKLRKEWRSLSTLRSTNVVKGQSVSPGRVRQVIQRKDADGFRLGGKDGDPLYDIARLQEDIEDLIANSGTPTGEMLSAGNLTGAPMRAAAALAVEDPIVGAALANNVMNAARQQSLQAVGSRTAATIGVQASQRQKIEDERNRLLEEVIAGFR